MTNKYLTILIVLILIIFKINGIIIKGNLCGEEKRERLVIITQTENQLNTFVHQDIMAVIFNGCPKYELNYTNLRNRSNLLTYKVCNDYMTHTRSLSNDSMKSNIMVLLPNQPIRFKLSIPSHQKLLKLQTEPCINESTLKSKWIFYWNNKEIIFRKNPNFNYSSNIFVASNISKTPIIMKMFDADAPPLTLELNINLIKTRKCSADKCIGDCIELRNSKLGYQCVVTINDRQFDAGYKDNICNIGTGREGTELSLCEYYEKSINKSLCMNECLSTQNCGYVCTKVIYGTLRIESGYIAYNKMWITNESKIGLDQVKWNQLPIEKVYFNECNKVNNNLCIPDRTANIGSSCVDKKIGFACSNGGHINQTQCLHYRSELFHPYWICNDDTKDFNLTNEKRNFNKLKKFILLKNISKTEKLDLIMFTIKLLKDSVNKKTNENDAINDRKKYATFLISQMENFNNINSSFSNNSIIVKNIPFPKNSNNYSVNLPAIAKDNSKQFINLELIGQPEESQTSNYADLKTNFIYYHKLDLIGENKTLDEEIKLSSSLINPNISRRNRTILLRNSDIFSIKFNKPIRCNIKYKIASYIKYKQGSWLFEIEEKCGFLDIEKGWVWSTKGCRKVNNDYCQCDHLTNFALLFSIRPINEIHLRVLEILSYFGGVVNIISLTLFLVFILAINTRDKLRLDQLNVALCLLTATVIYLFGGHLSNYNTICSLVAIASQFLFLSAFVWKLILGINVVRMVASIRYQEDWLIKYRTIFIVIGYTIPCVITAISAGIHYKDYGRVSNNVCWINSSSAAFLSFLVPVSIIIAINLIVLVYIAKVLVLNYINTRKTKVNDSNELLVFVQLLVSMGFTWIPSYLATISLTAMYVMVISFPFQGFLMFLLVVVINKENRDKVSSFLATISSKSSSTSDKTYSKTKSSTRTKTTDQNDSLLPKSNDTNGQKISIEMTNQNSEIHMTSEKC